MTDQECENMAGGDSQPERPGRSAEPGVARDAAFAFGRPTLGGLDGP